MFNWCFSQTYQQIDQCDVWLGEMGGDLGHAELDYSKRKAEDDLEQLEQSYRVLSNIEQDAESTEEVRNSATECKTKLEEAMNRLRDFLCEVEKALEYEKKQEFLTNVSF